MPETDYRKFRLNKLNTEEFSHLKLLLFWPVFGLLFTAAERLYTPVRFYPVHCTLDDLIPFCEWFLLPYLFWFVFLIGTLAYTLFRDVNAFKRMMHFIIFTYTVTIVLYFLFPTCQQLRPEIFPRDNALTRFMGWFYRFDTNTNVCPSIHVLGSFAALFGLCECHRFQTRRGWKLAFAGVAVLISVSTVFVKQHSALDVAAALPLCAAGYAMCFGARADQGVRETASDF